MPSIVPGFEYDIFISYRQKDNRGDRWVTEFVNALKSELDATFKEDLSVYFDENPNDGLLETHDVDASLREKLKCLIFIPIISQTYCDPKSYAWNKEFLAFIKQAGEDGFGLKLKLQNGNVAGRVLPVRIHELDDKDKATIQSELGPLRSIDFIFKSAGVNRPLRAHEDHPHDNQNKTFYRDQINKAAIAIKDLVQAMTKPVSIPEKGHLTEPLSGKSKFRSRALPVMYIFIASCIGYYVYEKVGAFKKLTLKETSGEPNSIAVLPFDNLSNDPEQEYFCDGTTEQIISSLARLKDLKVIARTSVMQYKTHKKTISEIGRDLNVTHVLEGSVRKAGNKIRVTAQLIAVRDESHLWVDDYENKVVADIFQIQDNVATKIAESLRDKLLPGEKEKLKSERANNPEAYEHYLKGEYLHGNYFLSTFRDEDFENAEREFKSAIQLDSNYATAWAGLSNLYDSRSNFTTNVQTKNKYRELSTEIGHRAFKINSKLAYTLLVEAQNWLHRKTTDASIDSAFKYFKLAYETSPNRGLICSEFGGFFAAIGIYNHALRLMHRAKEIDPTRAYRYIGLGIAYDLLFDLNASKKNAEAALRLEPNNMLATELLLMVNIQMKNFRDSELLLKRLKETLPNRDFSDREGLILALKGEKEKALRKSKSPEIYAALKMKKQLLDTLERGTLLNYLDFKNSQFDFLRTEERFQKIVEKARGLYETRLKKYGNIDLPKE